MDITPELIAKKLNAAADLLETTGWTKGDFAQNAEGRSCTVDSKKAVCFCIDGAIRRVIGPASKIDWMLRGKMINAVEQYVGIPNLIDWNDTRRSAKSVIVALRGAAKQVFANGV